MKPTGFTEEMEKAGAVMLGRGGCFKVPEDTTFAGWCWDEENGWDSSPRGRGWGGEVRDYFYAAPADSEVARMNGMGREKAPDPPSEPEVDSGAPPAPSGLTAHPYGVSRLATGLRQSSRPQGETAKGMRAGGSAVPGEEHGEEGGPR